MCKVECDSELSDIESWQLRWELSVLLLLGLQGSKADVLKKRAERFGEVTTKLGKVSAFD